MTDNRDDVHRQAFLAVKDSNTGKIKRIAFPADVQIGLSDEFQNLQIFGSIALGVKTFRTSDSFTCKVDDVTTIAEIDNDVSGSTNNARVFLPRRPRAGHFVQVKDVSGTALSSSIIISGSNDTKIDDQLGLTLSSSYGSVALYWSPSRQWRVLNSSAGSANGSATDLTGKTFLTVNNESDLTNERRFVAGTGLISTDAGANSTFTLAINNGVVATVSGTTFTGPVNAATLSGSLQRLTTGQTYLVAGTGILITSASNGQVLIESSGSALVSLGDRGFIQRLVYVHPSSSKVGTTFAGVTVAATPADWTTADNIPSGSQFLVDCAGGGGGGSSGASASNTAGGCAGGGGARNRQQFNRAELVAALPITFTIELGGTTGSLATGGVSKVPGTVGGNAFFGNLLTAYGGGTGGAGSTTAPQGGSGGGSSGPGQGPGTLATAIIGGLPCSASGSHGDGWGGAGVLTNSGNETLERARMGYWGGGAGGGVRSNAATSNPGGGGGRSQYGGGGGGGGGSHGTNAANTAAGGAGGKSGGQIGGNITGGGAAGGAGSSTTPGSPGNDGSDGDALHNGDGGGGGGSAGSGAGAAVGGNGGNGGFPGGGGGGGGGCRVGNVGDDPGDGGRGGDPMIMITVLR